MDKESVRRENPQPCDVVYGIEQLRRWNEDQSTTPVRIIIASHAKNRQTAIELQEALEKMCDDVNRTMYGYEILIEKGDTGIETVYPQGEVYAQGETFRSTTLRTLEREVTKYAQWATRKH